MSTSNYRLKCHEIYFSSNSIHFFLLWTFWHTCHAGATWQTRATCFRQMKDLPSTPSSSPARLTAHMAYSFLHPIYQKVLFSCNDVTWASESVSRPFQGCFGNWQYNYGLQMISRQVFWRREIRTVEKDRKRTLRRTVGATCQSVVGRWASSFRRR